MFKEIVTAATILNLVSCASLNKSRLEDMINLNEKAIEQIEQIQKHTLKIQGKPLKYVVLGDPHPYLEKEIFEGFLSQIEELKPDFVLNLGDLTHDGGWLGYKAYLRLIDEFEIPMIHIPGNHEQIRRKGLNRFNKFFGKGDFYFDYENFRFIGFNNAIPENYGVSNKQLSWLEESLDDGKENIVFMHVPLQEPFKGVLNLREAVKNEDKFQKLLEDYGVELVYSGHIHRYVNVMKDGIRYIISGGGGRRMTKTYEISKKHGKFNFFLYMKQFNNGSNDVYEGNLYKREGLDTLYNFKGSFSDSVPIQKDIDVIPDSMFTPFALDTCHLQEKYLNENVK